MNQSYRCERFLSQYDRQLTGRRHWFKLGICLALALVTTVSNDVPQASAQKKQSAKWEDEIVPQGRYIFRWGLREGQELNVQLSQNVVTTSKGGLVDTGEIPFCLKMTQKWVVEDRQKDTAIVLQTFRSLSIKFKHPTIGEVAADTNQPEPELPVGKQIHRSLMKFVGQQMRMKIDKLGTIKSIAAVSPDDSTVTGGVADSFSPAQLKNIFSQVAVFKTLTYKPGDSWNAVHKIKNGPLEAQLDLEYQFDSVEGTDNSVAKVNLKPVLTLKKDQERVSIESQEGSGQLLYSFETMQVLETKLHQELQLKINHDDPENPPLMQTVVTDTSVQFKLTKAESEKKPAEADAG